MKNKAFTLAEVLIVMALIGFLFTLTLPHLVQKQSGTKFAEYAKTAQEKLQTSFDMTSKKYNGAYPMDWPSVRESYNKSEAIVKELAQTLQVMSFCGDSDKGCFSSNGYRTLNGVKTSVITDDMEPFIKFINSDSYATRNTDDIYTEANPMSTSTYISFLNGGSAVFKTSSTKCNGQIPSSDTLDRPLCGVIYVDVNGQSIPNMLGVDVFGFYISGNNIIPMGFYGDQFAFDYNCLRETPKTNKYNGLGCSAWAIKNKNMEYRKCQAGNRLGWTTNTRCDVNPAQ